MATISYKAQEAVKTCDEHEHKELTCFCKTCKKFICISCGQTPHHGHEWDIIISVAKERRIETPKLCRKIKRRKYHNAEKNGVTLSKAQGGTERRTC